MKWAPAELGISLNFSSSPLAEPSLAAAFMNTLFITYFFESTTLLTMLSAWYMEQLWFRGHYEVAQLLYSGDLQYLTKFLFFEVQYVNCTTLRKVLYCIVHNICTFVTNPIGPCVRYLQSCLAPLHPTWCHLKLYCGISWHIVLWQNTQPVRLYAVPPVESIQPQFPFGSTLVSDCHRPISKKNPEGIWHKLSICTVLHHYVPFRYVFGTDRWWNRDVVLGHEVRL